jgi:hypothetical protein
LQRRETSRHRDWFARSALADLLGADLGLAEIHKLYACHDRLRAHKQALFDHLVERWRDLFNASFDVLLYDLTSTYFEADPPFPEGDKRLHGYSRDHRPHCVQVVIALAVTPEGLPLAYEVLPGNTADNTTLRNFLDRIERQYGKARRIWLTDRGVPTEEVLAEMRAADPPVQYVVGTPGGTEPPGAGPPGQAVAGGAARRASEAVAAGWRALRLRAGPRSRRQRARDAPAPAQMAVEAARANRRHEAHARGAADEARRCPQPSPYRLAPDRGHGAENRFDV